MVFQALKEKDERVGVGEAEAEAGDFMGRSGGKPMAAADGEGEAVRGMGESGENGGRAIAVGVSEHGQVSGAELGGEKLVAGCEFAG